MIKALDPCTRGYLVSQLEVSVKQELDWSRSWVAIDGSTMFIYKDEEVCIQCYSVTCVKHVALCRMKI